MRKTGRYDLWEALHFPAWSLGDISCAVSHAVDETLIDRPGPGLPRNEPNGRDPLPDVSKAGVCDITFLIARWFAVQLLRVAIVLGRSAVIATSSASIPLHHLF